MFSYWRKRRSATKTFNIVLLNGSTLTLQLESRCSGNELVRRVLEDQRILSNQEIFGLTTLSDNYRRWLNLGKPVKKQISGHSPYTVHLCVWAYPRDHHSILQSVTRHQLYLQVKQDLLQGRLKVANENVCGSILGHIVQREVGDFEQQTCGDGYIHEMNLLPSLTSSQEESVSRNHRANRGVSEREAEETVLNLAQGEFMYGTHSYTVQDSLSKRSTLQLSICPAGVRVSESLSAIITYEWEVIERVAHKGKQLYIDLILNTKTPPPQGPTQFSCASTHLSTSLCYWCGFLREFYCHGNPPDTRSRLRRFFSYRRSVRRRPTGESRRRRLSGSVEERRSSFGNDSRYTKAPQPHQSTSDAESKGLVVYGASGLASQDLPVTSYDITPIAEVVVHNELKTEELAEMSHDMNHLGNHVSHDPMPISHDQIPGKPNHLQQGNLHSRRGNQSHDLDTPEIKSLSNLVDHRSASHDLPGRSHDLTESSNEKLSRWNGKNNVRSTGSLDKSHDHSTRSRTSPHRSHDSSYRSHDSPHRSHTSAYKSHDSPYRSHDSFARSPDHHVGSYESPHSSSHSSLKSHDNHRRSHDSPHRSYDSPRKSHDHSRRSHDSLHQSHDSPYHSHNGYKHYELGPQRQSSRESSPVIDSSRLPQRRSSREHSPSERASSLTRHIVPDYPLTEDEEWVGHVSSEGRSQRYIDPAAKPKNRIRLSLPDSAYHEIQGRRGTRLSMSSRRARNTSITSGTSLSQPMEGTQLSHNHPLQALSAKLGSIASLEAQASLAELSQAESYMDPHMRSFVFQASQPDTATEL